MQQLTEKLKMKKRRGSTDKTYKQAWYSFNDFLIDLDNRPDSWNERLVLFIARMVEIEVSDTTLMPYISGIRGIL